ncbi:PP2C domain-containing protein [Daphnia magna]|uniref:PP2C domain-containing protein n=1 Tax=Daphnia magna TaxID=35525 RepID=A0A0P5URC3_9CRUS|nr:PP2C domain-containing protein [Daphnia magna]
MPSIKQKFAGFFRQISNSGGGECLENANQMKPLHTSDSNTGCFIQRYLNGESRLKQPDILFGRTGQELPCLRLCSLQSEIIATHTGPDGGLTTVNRGQRGHVTSQDPDVSYIDSEDDAVPLPSTISSESTSNDAGRARSAELVTIRAMGQTFVVRNHLPPTPPQPPRQPIPTLPLSTSSASVAMATSSDCHNTDHCRLSDDDDDELSTVCEDPSPPVSTPTSSSTSPPIITSTSTCADESDDYQDFLSKFGILSLPLHPSLDRQSVVQIDSPDDTLVSGSLSPLLDQLDPLLTPDVPPSIGVNAAVQPEVSDEHLADHEELPTKEPTPAAEPPEPEIEIAGVVNWNRPSGIAFGAATSLYERHPISGETAGNPLADAFAIVTRSNNALMCLADGVNWGERAALAARSAIHGAMDYLNRALFPSTTNGRQLTTNDVFLSLLRSFHAAHSMILQEGGLLTTLTAAVVAQLDQSSLQNSLYTGSDNSNSAKFVVCVCNVGDSLAYVYSPKHGVREITHGSHDIQSMRDMRDALGALGPVDGQNPELNNLTCSMTVIEEGDIVFLTSDGVSDNFDPVVGKFVVARKPDKIVPLPNSAKQTTKPPNRNLPTVEAFQRHELTLLRMEDILRNGMMPTNDNGNHLKAQQLCEDLVDFATRLTTAKRRLLEDLELYVDQDGKPLDPEEQKIRRRKICERLALIPGKLDHATCVAYEARIQPPNPVNIAGTEALTREMVASYPFRESSI